MQLSFTVWLSIGIIVAAFAFMLPVTPLKLYGLFVSNATSAVYA